jgi:hypothetical protein
MDNFTTAVAPADAEPVGQVVITAAHLAFVLGSPGV